MFLVVVLVIVTVVRHLDASTNGFGGPGSGSCVGGPASGSSGQPVGDGNVRFPCSGGGSVTVHLGN
jgi:hypothetical protein